MEFIIFLTVFLLAVASIVTVIITVVSWTVHISMVKDACDTYGWGSRKLFWENFKGCELKRDKLFTKSYFSDVYNFKNKSQVHASIIQFNGIGMLLNPIDYIVVNYELYKMRSAEDKKVMYKW